MAMMTESKKETNRRYYEAFRSKNAEKIQTKEICPVCFGHYTYYYKSAHLKTSRHLSAQKLREASSGKIESTAPPILPQDKDREIRNE